MSSKLPLHQIADAVVGRLPTATPQEHQFAREVAAYLLDAGRVSELNSLAREMIKVRADHGTVEVTAVTSHELTAAERTEIRRLAERLFPKSRHIILNERRDSQLIGGVRLEFPDAHLDLSVRGKLNRFKALTA